MAEDLEKYRGLYNIVKNPKNTKQQEKLFDSAGLFGIFQSKYPKAFELFADWIREVKFEKHEINDNLIKVKKFTEFLAKQKGNEDLIKHINDLHQENIIKDLLPTDNTLLEFAKALIGLKIVEKSGESLGKYREARKNYVDSMKPLAEEKVAAKTTPEKSGQAKPVIGGKVSPVDAKTPESREDTSTSTGGGAGYEASEETNLNVNSSTSSSSSTETSTGIQPSTEKEAEKSVEKLVTPTVPVAPIIPVSSAIPVTPVSQKPAEVSPVSPIIIPEKTQLHGKDQDLKTSGLEEARKMEEKRAGEAQLEQPQASATPSIALPRFSKNRGKAGGKRGRVVSRRGANGGDKVRQKVQPDKARNRLTQNAQANAQNEQDNYDNQLTQNARNQQSAEEGADEGSKKKGSLAKKVLTGVGASTVAGGGFFAFLTGDTEAATFAISQASTTFKSIISLIHLFIK